MADYILTVLENCFKLLLIKHDDVRWSAGAAAGICEAEGGQVQLQSAGPFHDNPNAVFQVGDGFGFIISIRPLAKLS